MLLFTKRQEEKRAQTQMMMLSAAMSGGRKVDDKMLGDASQAYLNSLFPYHSEVKSQEDESSAAVLKNWTSQGPLRITPAVDLDKRSRTVRRVDTSDKTAVPETPSPIGSRTSSHGSVQYRGRRI